MNIGTDSSGALLNENQLDTAYDVADQIGFKLLISFDQGCCTWNVNDVSRIINKYQGRPSYYKVNGKPFVSTFEGPSFASQWNTVTKATGEIYLVPDWASVTPGRFADYFEKVDGACKESVVNG